MRAVRAPMTRARLAPAAAASARRTMRVLRQATRRMLPAGMDFAPSACGVAAAHAPPFGPMPAPPSAGRERGAKVTPHHRRRAAASVVLPPRAATRRVGTEAAPPLARRERRSRKRMPQRERPPLEKVEAVRSRRTPASVSSPSRRGASRSQVLRLPAAPPSRAAASPATRAQAAAGGQTATLVGTWRAVTLRPLAPWSQPCANGASLRQVGCRGR